MKHFTLLEKIRIMKKLRLILPLISIAFVLHSCQETIDGNGYVVTEKRILNDFTEIQITGMFEVILAEGEPAISIEADENLIPYIITNVNGEQLEINTNNVHLDGEKLAITIYYDDLEELKVSGAIELSTQQTLHSNKFKLDVTGAAKGEIDIDVNELRVEISGGAELVLVGTADAAEYEINGAGEIDAFDLKTDEAMVDIAGAGEINLFAEKELDVEISGAAEVNYKGSPKVSEDISGAGAIHHLD